MLNYIDSIQLSLPNEKRIVCCSDIIESYFGKMKNRGNKSGSQGITEDMLAITMFSSKLTNRQVEQAMAETTWTEVQQWAEKNMVLSFPKMKQLFWKKLAS